jgi:two-component system, OmpR family, response regulator RegX3
MNLCPTCGCVAAKFEHFGEFRIDTVNARIYRRDLELVLTAKDYGLALLLLRNLGAVVERQRIYKTVWPVEKLFHKTRTIDTHISRVRRKLGLIPANGWDLQSSYGRGYCLRQLRALKVAA